MLSFLLHSFLCSANVPSAPSLCQALLLGPENKALSQEDAGLPAENTAHSIYRGSCVLQKASQLLFMEENQAQVDLPFQNGAVHVCVRWGPERAQFPPLVP